MPEATTPPEAESISIFCDESCHLLRDRQRVMVLGGVWCPTADVRRLSLELRRLKVEAGLSRRFESKWTKVSASKSDFYARLVDFFFDEPALHFRGILIRDKGLLDHDAFGQSHDDWYYKMYFRLLQPIIEPSRQHRVYLDVKDTRSADKVRKLHEVLANARYDFDRRLIERIQTVRSNELEPLQLADLLIGAIAYRNRGLRGNAGKEAVVNRVVERSGKSLVRSTLVTEPKFNLFVWTPASGPARTST